jgi:hypothetical protein
VFDTAGQSITFEWTANSRWKAIAIQRRGGVANGVVIGTTALTGLNMWSDYFCSVTGTVSSTAANAFPNGSVIGDVATVRVSTAASIPSGSIAVTGLTNAGAAATSLGTMAGTTNYAALRWNGAAWLVIGNTTLVLS